VFGKSGPKSIVWMFEVLLLSLDLIFKIIILSGWTIRINQPWSIRKGIMNDWSKQTGSTLFAALWDIRESQTSRERDMIQVRLILPPYHPLLLLPL
jgi:hypothetical protein